MPDTQLKSFDLWITYSGFEEGAITVEHDDDDIWLRFGRNMSVSLSWDALNTLLEEIKEVVDNDPRNV